MSATTSTALSRDLGDELRLLRETTTKMNGRQFAVHLGWDPSKVSNIEHGKARASDVDLAQIMTACGKNLEYLQEFRSRYHNAFDPYFAQVSDNLRTLVMTEALATKITAYDVLTPHGLVQTEGTAQALLSVNGLHTKEIVEKFARLRIERQTILRRPLHAEFMFYIHELALQMLVGDIRTREDQYLRLLFNTHMLRVVPAEAKDLAFSTKCALYEFEKASPVVYTESDVANVFAQSQTAVAHAKQLFKRLETVALDAEQSKRKLAEYVSALREDRDDHRTDLA
ncbi:helix-turn-helix transcriptional regulator [Lentzea sp. NPDC042327]|uniref:helix-turn-helix domain-containing protein n=1 Tax=Lentzea sp. NPDC042327 TaxID=3154801 RepID=UPI0033E0197B